MKYYYLDSNRNICGPYSISQMSALFLNGIITPDTLCAAAGEQNWRPLSEQAWMRGGDTAQAPEPGPMGNCPHCGAEQVGFQLASSCPSCGAAQAPKDSSLWGFFCLALRRLFCFKGRAQRKEYWAYVLFSFLFILLSNVLIAVLMFGEWMKMSILITVYNSLVGLLFYPLLARRSHDIGLSGWWIILPFVLSLFSNITTVNVLITDSLPAVTTLAEEESGTMTQDAFRKKYPDINLSERQGEIHYSIRRERRTASATLREIEGMSNRLNYPFGTSPAMKTVARMLSLLNFVVSILVLLTACIDSQRGANKYGPSSKYPRSES